MVSSIQAANQIICTDLISSVPATYAAHLVTNPVFFLMSQDDSICKVTG
jgi:hypothetical protein